ncbi:MAG: pyridoxal-phosphate dependent enzyme [Acidobacteria bacterium]|nr:pyridoxal-phosphate dependent enzyme [Acidobacteriota bacterium]
MHDSSPIGNDEIRAARERIAPHVHRTPIMTCSTLDQRFDARLFFKCENFQKSGAFKVRGAFNAVMSMSTDDAERGVVTSSSGNQAAAVALAAAARGIPAYIAMPNIAVESKVRSVERYGGNIVRVESRDDFPTIAEYDATVTATIERTGASFVHPYDDRRTIAGQASCAAELLEDAPDLDLVLAPVGGGGLLSGTCLAAGQAARAVSVIGCEPLMADDAAQSLAAGTIVPQNNPRTVADGLRTSLGDLNFPIIRDRVEQIATVSEESIMATMRLVWETMKLVIEPSAAVPLATLLEGSVKAGGRRVGVIFTGGNVDLDALGLRLAP